MESDSRKVFWPAGKIEVKYKLDNNVAIESAIVKYADKSKDELTLMQIQTNGEILGRYTTPDNVVQLRVARYS